MWRGIVRVTSIISGIVLGISGLVGSLRIASENPFLALIALAVTAVAVFVSIAPAMLIAEISEDVEDIKNEIRYLENKIIKLESQKEGSSSSVIKNGGWRCNNCGKANPITITRCSCGTAKGESCSTQNGKNIEYDGCTDDGWICRKCGKENSFPQTKCSCGWGFDN
ncbi:MAG: TMEM14 family protein [Clostridia bacterium]|nr:TMEM14 family protein [Clostridia bacterium]